MIPHFSMKELEKDMGQLRTGMKECGREVEFYRGQTLTSGDRYLPVMKEFMSTAQVRLTELEDLFTDMKARCTSAKWIFLKKDNLRTINYEYDLKV